MRKVTNSLKNFGRSLKGRDHSEDADVDERIILKQN
jgi:hypothetical protein